MANIEQKFSDWDILIEDLKTRRLGIILKPPLNCVWTAQLFSALQWCAGDR